MADIADIAGERIEFFGEVARCDAHRTATEQAARRAAEAACRFCAEPTALGVSFCGIECRDDFERMAFLRRINGRGVA